MKIGSAREPGSIFGFAVVILTNLEGGGRLGLAALANQIAEIVLRFEGS